MDPPCAIALPLAPKGEIGHLSLARCLSQLSLPESATVSLPPWRLAVEVEPCAESGEIKQHVGDGGPADRPRAPRHPAPLQTGHGGCAHERGHPSRIGTGKDSLGRDMPD